ncbi:MAG: endoribonuclease MazF [Candidatus Nitrohelix vancouverensis]|uniref:Endoribonuclease MazF n=1 Tax=Candidatus Nitrohelix vancouverensis TaxID=2705534 RepID=A0A7T0C0I1_9BACT|nr:MAG: endoribonuclease MazF [Candidatus Nitrohelix vancouverensis]
MVAKKNYVPEKGHIIWLDFNPQAGHEQAGHRPALVISPKIYNDKAGLALACPITSKIKNYPFAVPLPSKAGCVLVDQIKSVDWRVRQAKYKSKAPKKVMEEVLGKLGVLIFDEG